MGIQDFTAVFDALDLSSEGFISCEKLHEFDEILHYTPLCIQHVYAAVSQICGGDGQGTVGRDNFRAVLQELDRRRAVEERAYWDFQALDSNADGRLPLKDALLLFRDSHGERFSLSAWEQFLSQRESKHDEVCFDELRMWLCNLPTEDEATLDEDQLKSEEDKLEGVSLAHAIEEYDNAKHWQENAASEEKNRKDYQDSLLTQAERKQKKWDQEGIEALLFDDGKDVDGVTAVKSRQKIAIKDLYDLLEEKYNHLRQKLTWQMINVTPGASFSDSLAGDGIENYYEVESQVKQLWKSRTVGKKWMELPGSSSHLPSSLTQLMAELLETDAKHKFDVIGQYERLLLQGKSPFQACHILEEQYQAFCKGSQLCGEVMSDLFKRYQDEKGALASTIKTWVSQGDATSQVSKKYFQLLLQDILICGESSFVPAALACGLGERPQTYRSKRFDWDRRRMEMLAALYLAASKGRQPRKASPSSHAEESCMKKSELDLQVEILHQMVETFIAEREILISMLQGRDSVVSKSEAKKLSVDERRGTLNGLRSQRQSLRDGMASEASESQKTHHRKLLKEAVGIAYENRFLDLMNTQPNVTENAVNASLLADLQQKHFIELDTLIKDFISKDTKELKKLMKTCVRACMHEHLDTIAFVILGALDVSEEERRFIDVLEEKYQVIRETILIHALRSKHGTSWSRMSKEERHKELRAKKKEEKKLRGEGRWKEMASLLGPTNQDMPTLQTVMGENKADYSSRLEQDEIPPEKLPAINPFADLVVRQEAEQNYLLTWLRSTEVKAMTFAKRREGLVRMLLEKLFVEQETDYSCMGYRLGLVERIEAAIGNRHNADKLRQTKLCTLRCKQRRLKLSHNKTFKKEAVPKERPHSGDSVGWQMLFLNQVVQRHLEEVETLLQLCQDETLAELQEAAQQMTTEEQQKRLLELSAKRTLLDLENQNDREESLSILEEAAAIKTLSRKVHLESQTGGGAVTIDDVAGSLLEEVYQLQDKELALILEAITDKDEVELSKLFASEVNARQWEMVENVVMVITKYEGEANDDRLLQALDEKYDSLRDKLLMEALMKQLGEAEWLKLSEQERQRRLALLKLQERKLRKEGKIDELAKLLGDHELAEKNLHGLLGENRAEAERRLKERLADRQRRKALGESLYDNEDDLEEDVMKESDTGNVLSDLNKRYEQERDALMASLKGQEDGFWGEKERQAELLRLKRERRQAEREGRFDEAALVLGLAERQQQQLQERLKCDRKRQEMLAKSRLEELQKRKGKQKDIGKEEIVKTGGRTALQEAVLNLLERRHANEQERLYEMLSDRRNEGLRTEASLMSGVQREDRLAELRGKLQQVSSGKIKERLDILQQAVAVKMESRQLALSHSTDQSDVQHIDVCVSLMADLQEEQSLDTERMIGSLQNMDDDQLVALQEEILASKENAELECIVTVVFAPERQAKTSEGELLTVLEEKYDALRDKLLIEALMKQAGEANWQKLSEQERQRQLLELKLKERKLRQENKMDELDKILGNDIRNKEALEKLLGESKEDQRKKMQEKLEKRRQRLAEGLSEGECDDLEKAEEEEEAMKPQNVLLDLQHRFDQEKEELLRRLQASDGKFAQEQERQRELVRLKREQRKVHREDKFESAALVLGLAREAEEKVEKNLHEDRERQRRLARERLEARKNRKNDIQPQPTDVSTLGDSNDVVFLQECVSKEIEARHQAEREYLMQLLQECEELNPGPSSELEINHQMSQLQLLYKNWKGDCDGHIKDSDTLHKILLNAVGVQLGNRQEDNKDSTFPVDPQVALLADLQELQDNELRTLVSSMAEKDPESLRKLKAAQSVKRSDGHHDNLAVLLLSMKVEETENGSGDDALLQALDMKYDAFKDKLFMEAAEHKMGEDWWEAASEEERMRQVAELRLRDKQLREEGREDEANDLLENFLSKAGIEDLVKNLGEKETDDKERKAQQEKLRQERLEAGMSLDEVLQLEESQEEIDGKSKRKNILDMLSHSYEDEKVALLASLQGQEDRLAAERQRQLEMAKLHRDKRRLQQAEKLDSAVILLEIAQKQESELKKSLEEEHCRQRALAQNRLTARRQKKQGIAVTNETSVEDKLRQQHHDNLLEDGKVTVEGILQAVETKQTEEREMLLQLVQAVNDDEALKARVELQTPQEIRQELQAQQEKRTKWLMMVQQTKSDDDKMNDDKYIHQLVASRAEQFHLWKICVALKCEDTVRQKLQNSPGTKKEEVWEEVTLDLLTVLQVKQASETEAVQAALLSIQDEGTLDRVKQAQRRACREGWYITLAEVIFSTQGGVQEETQFQESLRTARSKAEAEGLSAEETESILENLRSQHEAHVQRTNSVREDQQRQVQEKLAMKRRKKSFQEDTEDQALNVLLMSGAQAEVVQDLNRSEKLRQNTLMQERLALRRAARKKSAEQNSTEDDSRPSTQDSSQSNIQRPRRKLSVEVTDDQKHATYSQLVRQQSNLYRKISEQQSRQEEMLQRRLEQINSRREEEAAALFSLGERQKTVLEKSKQDERERQVSRVQERVARVRYERTMTMRERSRSPLARGFDQIKEDEKEDESKHDQMNRMAQNMESKFKGQNPTENGEKSKEGLMTDQSRLEKLKQRRVQKREKRLTFASVDE